MEQAVFGRPKYWDGDTEGLIPEMAKHYDMSVLAPNLWRQQDKSILQKTYGASGGHDSSTGAGSYAGYTVPSPLSAKIIEMYRELVWVRGVIRTIPMSAPTLTIPRKTSLESTYLISEGADFITEAGPAGATSAVTAGVYEQITLTCKKFASLGGYTTELGEDSLANWAKRTLSGLLESMAYAEEKAFIQGELSGTTMLWSSGDPRYAFDGFLWKIAGTNADTGGNWTPDDITKSMWIDGGSDKLTNDELLGRMAIIEENTKGGVVDIMVARPMVMARLRDPTEFEQLQTLKDIGMEAGLIAGHIGRYYTMNLIQSTLMPVGTSGGFAGTGAEFVSNADDTIVMMMKSAYPVIGDRRKLEIRKRHRFYQDIEEVRLTQRIAFQDEQKYYIAGIADVKNSW